MSLEHQNPGFPDIDLIHNPVVRVLLSDTETWFNIGSKEDWFYLKEYIEKTKLRLTNMCVAFRDHVECLPDNMDGYYFSYGHAAIGIVGPTVEFKQFVTGYVIGETLYIKKWMIPELVEVETDIRNINDTGKINHKGLILNEKILL